MANQPSPTVEELQLRKRARRRLIGAITLVVLMVTVLPMVLDDEPKPVGQDIAISIPSPQATDAPFSAAPAPVQTTPAEPEKPVAVVEKAAEPKPKPAPSVKEDEPAEKPAEKPKEVKTAAKVVEPTHAGSSYVVLLGAFMGESNAKQRQAELKKLGVKYYVEKIRSPAGEKTAVRAGPYPSRQDAEHVLAKLKSAGITDGMVAEKK